MISRILYVVTIILFLAMFFIAKGYDSKLERIEAEEKKQTSLMEERLQVQTDIRDLLLQR